MNLQRMSLVMIPQEGLVNLKTTQVEILAQLKNLSNGGSLPMFIPTTLRYIAGVHTNRISSKNDKTLTSIEW
jgi:hypothetical protein